MNIMNRFFFATNVLWALVVVAAAAVVVVVVVVLGPHFWGYVNVKTI